MGYFLVMWSNAPRIPSQGMEALISLPYAFASLAMAPFIVGIVILLWKRPLRAALKPAYVIPTIVLTLGGVFAFYVTPRASAVTYEIPMVFVDEQGTPLSGLAAKVVHSSPGFDLISGSTTRREETFLIPSSEFTLIKRKGEETEIRIEKDGYYLTKVTIPHVLPARRNYGLQLIHIGWQKNWGSGRWGVDACQASMNWPLYAKEPFKVVMLAWSSPAKSPLPEYSEEDFQLLQNANK